MRTTQQTGQHGGIRSSGILPVPATPDDGASQVQRSRVYISHALLASRLPIMKYCCASDVSVDD